MAANRLDEIDRKILAELQDDGRMTNVELARRVGISAPPCLRRVRTLAEVVAALVTEYEVEAAQAEQDVLALIAQLESVKAIAQG